MGFVVEKPQEVSIEVVGTSARFPVRRIYCAGMNFADHLREMGVSPERRPPVFFAKPTDAIVQTDAKVAYPPGTENFHYEVELVAAIGRRASHVSAAEAGDLIYGYAVGIDLTRRDLQIGNAKQMLPWEIGKSFDASAPCGPIVPADQVKLAADARIWLSVNGAVRQDGKLSDMLWSTNELIAALSELFVLEPGDLIYTGTPAGVSAVVAGDKLVGGVDGLPEIRIEITEPVRA